MEDINMNKSHQQNIYSIKKRRKDKNNPYTIFSTGSDIGDHHYFISFTGTNGIQLCIEVSKELFDQFDQWELEDLSFLHEVERHYEQSELTDQSLYKRALQKPMTPENIVFQEIERKELIKAMSTLTDVQYRRLIMYFWHGMSLQEIGIAEGCKYQAVQDSIERAYAKIKKYLKNRLV